MQAENTEVFVEETVLEVPVRGEDVLTPNEVARRLRCSRRTVYNLIGGGRLPSFRVGKLRRIRREDLERFIIDHRNE